MRLGYVDILIVNCNTDDLTNIAISSIFANLRSVDFNIHVFDNSYSGKFALSESNMRYSDRIRILDNTAGRLVNFREIYNKAKNKDLSDESFAKCNQGSFKHSMSIQYFIDRIAGDDMLLFDSDIILKRDVDFLDDSYLTVSDVELNLLKEKPGDFQIRFRPFIQYFNVKRMKELKIGYFDPATDPDYGRDEKYKSLQFDTGTAFMLKCMKTKDTTVRNIRANDYVHHMFAGTRRHDKQDIDNWRRIAASTISSVV